VNFAAGVGACTGLGAGGVYLAGGVTALVGATLTGSDLLAAAFCSKTFAADFVSFKGPCGL